MGPNFGFERCGLVCDSYGPIALFLRQQRNYNLILLMGVSRESKEFNHAAIENIPG
jgi:hypothetical protein